MVNTIPTSDDMVHIPFQESDVESSIPAVFERRTKEFGNRIAIQSDKESYTYHSLQQTAHRICEALLAKLGVDIQPVAILLSVTGDAIAAMLGVLKAGKIYLHLDATLPLARLQYLMDDSQARAIITDTETIALAYRLGRSRTTSNFNFHNVSAAPPADELPNVTIGPDHLAALIYTSGSTAQPKGVVHSHRGLLHKAMIYTNLYKVVPQDRIGLLRTMTVIGGTTHSLGALMNGAALIPFDVKYHGALKIVPWLRANRITMCSFGPKLLRSIADLVPQTNPIVSLRRVTLSGEPVFQSDVSLCKHLFSPDCTLFNSLGATETPFATQYPIHEHESIGGNLVPVGYPASDTKIVLYKEMNDAADSKPVGEIAVQSRYLAVGYWRDPDLTRAKFLPADGDSFERIYLTGDLGRFLPDGSLLHLGRKDNVVKVRGFRVGLLEIEAALLEHADVLEAAVLADKEPDGDHRLIAYIVPKKGRPPAFDELSRFLSARLPAHMVPARFVVMREFPQLNNKIDRQALLQASQQSTESDRSLLLPQTEIEKAIIEIWQQVLGAAPFGIDEPFLAIGGDSLKATTIIARLLQRFNCEVSIPEFFEASTVAGLAAIFQRRQQE